jgi:streptomycin 6-kinase
MRLLQALSINALAASADNAEGKNGVQLDTVIKRRGTSANWHLEDARTRRQDACATAVAQASSLLVHGASQLRVPSF